MKQIALLIFTFILLISSSCKSTSETDTISGATPPYNPNKKVNLPVKSDTYIVLGKLKGLKNFAVQYDSKLIRGGELYSDSGIDSLKKMKIKTIVSITPSERERKLAKDNNIKLIEMPFNKKTGVAKKDLKKFHSLFINANTPIYLHCHGGTHRAGILGAAYRIHKLNWSYKKAEKEYILLGGSLKTDKIMLDTIK